MRQFIHDNTDHEIPAAQSSLRELSPRQSRWDAPWNGGGGRGNGPLGLQSRRRGAPKQGARLPRTYSEKAPSQPPDVHVDEAPRRTLEGLDAVRHHRDRQGVAMRVHYLGGPTAILELGGVRLLTDPTFDPPGDYPIGERLLTKTEGPALDPDEVGPIDAVLLSHDQHPDNLDRAGREYLDTVPAVLSTASARERLGDPVRTLPAWEQTGLGGERGASLRITGVPARHGPEGSEQLVGEVTGFVLSGPGLPNVYVSGDNASIDLVRTIAQRLGPFNVALLSAGAAQTALLDGAFLTLTSQLAAEAVRILGSPQAVPLHFEGWAHYTQGAETLRSAFRHAGLGERLHLLRPGERIDL
jgi:L-ascorbate metabolism protein UlaG (beta-lactamase superfamily)